jgi:hypothetical protein
MTQFQRHDSYFNTRFTGSTPMSQKLKMQLNLGTADAEKLGLDPDDCKDGQTVTVGSKAVADELLKRGWAVAEGDDARSVQARNPAEPQPQATNAPAGINVAITDNPGTATVRTKRGAAASAAAESDADTSPLSDSNADEAIDQIGRMRSRDKLQHVVDNDTRVSVQNAARERLKVL